MFVQKNREFLVWLMKFLGFLMKFGVFVGFFLKKM